MSELPPEPRLAGARVAVVGLGRENLPLVRFLLAEGARVTAFDRQPAERLGGAAAELRQRDVPLHLGPDYLERLAEGTYDYVVLTPGMRKDLPEVRAAADRGARLVGQMNFFFAFCRAPIVGVTGSSGKSTTTALVGELLAAPGDRPVYVGGNIGRVLIEQVRRIPERAWVVLELSSFQLELLDRSPRVAVVLNVRPNHLDVHGSMEAYAAAKAQIVRHQRPGDVAVLNAADPVVRDMAGLTPGQPYWFLPPAAGADAAGGAAASGVAGAGSGASPGGPPVARWEDRWLVLRRPAGEARVLPADEVPLPGRHNLGNVLAAAAAADACGVPAEAMRAAIRAFRPLEHRLEPVAEVAGVRYVNDSIATAPDRAVAALESFDAPVVLIAGGYDKGVPFDGLAAALLARRVRAVVLVGKAAPAIARAVEEAAARRGAPAPPLLRAASFEEAVERAAAAARPGDVVLLSPACASYDMFRDFEERGRRFKELVAELARRAGVSGAVPPSP